MYDYGYLVGALFWIVIWIAVFFLSPRSRSAIIWTSLIFVPAGPVGEYWNLMDYWHPHYLISIAIGKWRFGVEDIILSFALAGVSAGIFESVALRRGFSELSRVTSRTLLKMLGWGSVGFLLMTLFSYALPLISIHALLLAITITSFLMISKRKEIFPLILPLAAIFGFIYWCFYVFFGIPLFPGAIEALWDLDATWGIMLMGVPVEELLWAALTMLFAGPVFRVCSEKNRQNYRKIK